MLLAAGNGAVAETIGPCRLPSRQPPHHRPDTPQLDRSIAINVNSSFDPFILFESMALLSLKPLSVLPRPSFLSRFKYDLGGVE